MRVGSIAVVFAFVLVVAACGGSTGGGAADTSEPRSAPTAATTTLAIIPATTTSVRPTTTTLSATTEPVVPDWQLVIVSDSFSMATWPERWGELIQQDLGLTVEVKNHMYEGHVDYAAVVQEPEVRSDLAEAEVIFIPPEADYLRVTCEPGASECRDQAIEDYRVQWGDLLDEIQAINPDALLRSVKAWVWMAPPDGRAGLLAFMDAAAEVTEAHGGLVIDVNTMFTGPDHDAAIPNDWLERFGHFRTEGSIAIAETLHGLGYAT